MARIISIVSIVATSLITTFLIILLGVFNGIEQMVENLYSDYDASITVRSSVGKTFIDSPSISNKIKKVNHVSNVARAVEEIVVLKNEKKWANAEMLGVDESFLSEISLSKHIIEGEPFISNEGQAKAVAGASLLDKVDGYLPVSGGVEYLQIYTPLREASISKMKSPFKVVDLNIVGKMNYNREVNASQLIVPLEFAREQLEYDQDITAYFVAIKKGVDIQDVKDKIQSVLGKNFIVKTAYEKNELIFKTSQSEKRIVILILCFVFVLASFNLISALIMLFIEKKENLATLLKMGGKTSLLQGIFFFVGMSISGLGMLIGVILGVGVCLLQLKFKLIEMPNSFGEAFPIKLGVFDVSLVIFLVMAMSSIASYLPIRFLVKRFKN